MSRVRTFLLAGGLGFLAVIPVGAQFHRIYGRSNQVGELTSVASTSMPGAIASGSFNDGSTQGVLLKIRRTGQLDWVRAYGPTQLSAVRETPGGFAWIGTGAMVKSQGSAPVVAGVDPLGAVLWARRLHLTLPDGTPADQAYGRFLEVDPKGGGHWVGGDLWFRTADDPQPWLGKLDRDGNLLWAKTLDFSANARFFSIFPAFDGGIIAVGQIWARDNPSRDHAGMLAVKLGAGGNFVWGFRYLVQNTRPSGEQRLADLDRDPRSSQPESAVVGTVTGFCKSTPSTPCDPVESAAFVATLDENTGRLSNTYGLFSTSRPQTFGETIVRDLPGETTAVGGEIAGKEPGSRQGFLALLTPGLGFVRRASVHGAGTFFDAEVRSLDRWRDGNDSGYLFLMNETSTVGIVPTWLRSLVRTDRDGSSGACEQCTELKIYEAWIDGVDVQPKLRDGGAEPFQIPAMPFELVEAPCGARPCGDPAPGHD